MAHQRAQPLPKTISDSLYSDFVSKRAKQSAADDDGPVDRVRNIGVVQWAQFVEHDLAKTVFRTMGE